MPFIPSDILHIAKFPLDAVLYLHSIGINIFERSDGFIRKQYLGDLAETAFMIKEKYDFIFDKFGSFYYTDNGTMLKNRLFERALDLTGANGIFYMYFYQTDRLKLFDSLPQEFAELAIYTARPVFMLPENLKSSLT